MKEKRGVGQERGERTNRKRGERGRGRNGEGRLNNCMLHFVMNTHFFQFCQRCSGTVCVS